MVAPLLLASLAAAAPAILGGAGSVVAGFSKDAREARKMRAEDLKRLRDNRLGYTKGQKRSSAREAGQQIDATMAPMADELQQQIDASGSFGRSGYNRAGLQALQSARAQAMARAWNDIEKRSQEKTSTEEARIRGAAPLVSPWAGLAAGVGTGAGEAVGYALGEKAKSMRTAEDIARAAAEKAESDAAKKRAA